MSHETPDSADPLLYEALDRLGQIADLGDAAALDALINEYPQHAEYLRRMMPAVQEMRCLASDARHAAGPTSPIKTLGDFELLAEIGRGGMAIVYEARQISLARRVALKVLPFAPLLNERHLQRFQNEARAAALLKHRNVVSVYAVGSTRGVHYYAMELVDGHSLAELVRYSERCRLHTPPPGPPARSTLSPTVVASADSTTRGLCTCDEWFRRVVRFGIQAAEGLEHAHQQGIVHRDVKPSNLLVDRTDHLWVADFGLAQVATDQTLTATGELLGTLRYMSPEQARGERILDQRTDIYSLGISLYELLAGRPAFDAMDRQQLWREISETDPPPLSKLAKRFPTDLDTVIMKATARDRSLRYSSAGEFADDLRRFLSREPVRARRIGPLGRARRWIARNRTVSGLLALSLVLLFLVAATSIVGYLQATHALYDKDVALLQAGRQQTAAYRSQYIAEMQTAFASFEAGNVGKTFELLESHRPRPSREDVRGWEWHYLLSRFDLSPSIHSDFDDRFIGNPLAVLCNPRQPLVVKLCTESVQVLDMATWKPLWTKRGQYRRAVWCPDGSRLALVDAEVDHSVEIVGGRTGDRFAILHGHSDTIYCMAWEPDSHTFCTASHDGTVRRWNARTGVELESRLVRFDGLYSASFSPDCQHLAIGKDRQRLVVFDLADGSVALDVSAHAVEVCQIVWHPDGQRLISAGLDGAVKVWHVAKGVCEAVFQHPSRVATISMSSDGRFIAVGTYGARASIWDLETHQLIRHVPAEIRGMCFSSDSKDVLTIGLDTTLRKWPLSEGTTERTFAGERFTGPLAWHPSGRSLAIRTESGDAVICNLVSGAIDKRLRDTTALFSPAFNHDGRWLAWEYAARHSQAILADMNDGAERTGFEQCDHISAVCFSPDDSQVVVTAGHCPLVKVWNVSSGSLVAEFRGDERGVFGAAWSPDGTRVATGGWDGKVTIWDTSSWNEITSFGSHRMWIGFLSWDQQGRRIVSAGHDGSVRVWDSWTGQRLHHLRGHTGYIYGVGWLHGQNRVFSAGAEGTIRIWDVVTGREVLTFDVGGPLNGAGVSPDGKTIAAVAGGRLHVFDASMSYAPVVARRENELKAEWAYVRAAEYSSSGDGELSNQCMAELSEAMPGREGAALVARAHNYFDVSQLERGLADLTSALEVGVKHGSVHLLRGYLLSRVGPPEAVLDELDAAIETWDCPCVRFQRASWLLSKGDLSRALPDLQVLLKQRPGLAKNRAERFLDRGVFPFMSPEFLTLHLIRASGQCAMHDAVATVYRTGSYAVAKYGPWSRPRVKKAPQPE